MTKAGFEGLKGLVRLVYASRRAVDTPARLEDQLRQIIIQSISNNRMNNVTGALFAHEGWFVQVLEGPAAAVEVTFHRICEDERHDDITVIDLKTADDRCFRDWHMMNCQANKSDVALLEQLGQDPFDPVWLSGDEALELLTTLAQGQNS